MDWLRRWLQARKDREAKALGDGYVHIIALSKLGLVNVEGYGDSITSIWVEVASRVTVPLRVTVPHGTYFKRRGSHQNMAAARKYEFWLGPRERWSEPINAVCINAECPIPSSKDRFKGVSRASEDVCRFIEEAENEDAMTIQAGVWAITDGYGSSGIKQRLRVRKQRKTTTTPRDLADERYNSVFSQIGRDRIDRLSEDISSLSFSRADEPAISDAQIYQAKLLLDKLGIRNRL